MIRYALKCDHGHSFESWFQSADAFDALASRGMVSCAVCGCSDVRKALMTPGVSVRDLPQVAPPKPPAPARDSVEKMAPSQQGAASAPSTQQIEHVLRALRAHVEKHSTYVGGRFAAEARAMHLGEKDEQPIHGEASPEEARALLEDGIEIAPLPFVPREKAN